MVRADSKDKVLRNLKPPSTFCSYFPQDQPFWVCQVSTFNTSCLEKMCPQIRVQRFSAWTTATDLNEQKTFYTWELFAQQQFQCRCRTWHTTQRDTTHWAKSRSNMRSSARPQQYQPYWVIKTPKSAHFMYLCYLRCTTFTGSLRNLLHINSILPMAA